MTGCPKGNVNLIYPTVYNKAHEMELHSLTKIKNRFSEQSREYNYLLDIISFCKENGVVRFEQKLKSRFLQKNALNYWGLSDYSILNKLHSDFLELDKKLSVNAMDFETISDHLVSSGVVETTRAANTTAMYAIQWFHGHVFDFNKNRFRHIGRGYEKLVSTLRRNAMFLNSLL